MSMRWQGMTRTVTLLMHAFPLRMLMRTWARRWLLLEQLLQPFQFAPLPVEDLQVKRHPRQRAIQLVGRRNAEAVDDLACESVCLGPFQAFWPIR
ncbi:hypothetical protein Pan97_42210 [Bremerella volcania]|uniref:Uncharacterized protein n=1 Tax=Bremerella volcania TaxID=2527984 RepID=A0A518CD45_9BACT|nr:hypothetical protein Pan97_42210 [Bremerella volcania]